MFNKTYKYIILSKKGAFFVEYNNRFHVQSLNYSNSEEDIKNLIFQIKNFSKEDNLGVLISDDLVYVFSSKTRFINNEGKEIDEKLLVEEKIKSHIPENINEIVWDFKSVKIDNETKLFQIAVTNPLTTKIISKLFEENISVDFIEPISYSLARNIDNNIGISIIVSANIFENCIVIMENGHIHLGLTSEVTDFKSEFEEVLNYVHETYLPKGGFSSKIPIYVSQESIKELSINIPESLKSTFEIKTQNISVFAKEIIEYKEHHGKDNEVLNIVPEKYNQKSWLKLLFKNKKLLLSGLGFIIFFLFLTFFFNFNKTNSQTEQENNVSLEQSNPVSEINANSNDKVQSNLVVESQTLSKSDYENYKVIILNGSGLAGEAAKVAKYFTDLGFKEPDLGNYPAGVIKNTIIRTKEGVPNEIKNQALDLLKEYSTVQSENLEPLSPYDIQIVIGEEKL